MVIYLCLYAGALYAAFLTRYLKEKKIVAWTVMADAFLISVYRSYLMGVDYETYKSCKLGDYVKNYISKKENANETCYNWLWKNFI